MRSAKMSIVAGALLLLVAPAGAQRKSIRWMRDVNDGINLAKRSQRPIMFLVLGDSQRRDETLNQQRQKSMADPRVRYAARHYVPIQLVRSNSRYRALFEKLGVREDVNMEAIFSTPDGKQIGSHHAIHVPDTFAQKMTQVFRVYRKQLFEEKLREQLEAEKPSTKNLRIALKLIEKFTIFEAEEPVLKLFDNKKLNPAVAKQAAAALAELSTKAAVEFLLKHAADAASPHRKIAADALGKCTPVAAEMLVSELTGKDFARALAAYKAAAKICRVKNPKGDRFWRGDNARVKRDEVERVKRIVEKAAHRWRERYEEYR